VERAEVKVFAKKERYKKLFKHATSPKSLAPVIHAFRKSCIHTPYKVMELEKFPTIYMDAMHQLTGSGTGRVFENSILGPAFSIGCGTGQGDPPSAGRFNVGSDPLLRALNLISLAYRYTHSNGLKVQGPYHMVCRGPSASPEGRKCPTSSRDSHSLKQLPKG
jgi:hypothetical protein